MEHKYIDEFASKSPYSKVDPRTKLVALIGFLIIAAFLTTTSATLMIFLASVLLAIGSRIPVRHLMYGITPAAPFIIAAFLAIIFTGSLESAILLTLRISASVLIAVVFASTTAILDQARALQWFKVPDILVSMLMFAYRFIFVFIDELERMKIARIARGLGIRKGNILKKRLMRTLGQTVGMLFVRVNNRAIRVFDSLKGRGYSGSVRSAKPLRIGPIDILYSLCFVALLMPGIFMQIGVLQ